MIQINESIVAKTKISVPVNGGAVEAVSTVETVPYWTRSRKSGENLWNLMESYHKLIRLVLKYFFIDTCLFLQLLQHGLIQPLLTSLRLLVRLRAHQSQNQSNSKPPELMQEERNTTSFPKQ